MNKNSEGKQGTAGVIVWKIQSNGSRKAPAVNISIDLYIYIYIRIKVLNVRSIVVGVVAGL